MHRPARPGRACHILAGLAVGLMLAGCSSQPAATPELTAFLGPLAVPYADSLDAAWSDSLGPAPAPPSRNGRPKRKKPTIPANAGAPATGTSEATGLETGGPAAGGPAAEAPSADPAPAAPQLTVRVPPEEAVRLMERWQGDVARAEKALDQLKGWSLTGESAGQVTAARNFLGDSRTARTANDYYRACELAEKARVLAEAVRTSLGIK